MLESSIVCHYEVHRVEELVEHVWEGFCDNTKSHMNLSLRHFCMYFPLFFLTVIYMGLSYIPIL